MLDRSRAEPRRARQARRHGLLALGPARCCVTFLMEMVYAGVTESGGKVTAMPHKMTREQWAEWRQQTAQIKAAEAQQAQQAADEAMAGPLTPAQKQARYRARKRGETVPERKPGPRTLADRQRAALIAAQAENLLLREQVTELETENQRLADGNKRLRRRIARLEEQVRVLEDHLAEGAEPAGPTAEARA
jgi:hypothetical protein